MGFDKRKSFNEEYENVTLMYAKHEIRATMDIDHLLNKAVLLLDLPETSMEEIFNKIIHEMDIQEPEFTADQSICTANLGGGTFDFDQTWICAICMLPTVQHRHVAIARLSHPTNLGRTMQDLRFIIIVIAPSRAKGTKTALETARTFATLFADMDIRQRLVMAPVVDSFRQIMLTAAKDLALEQNQLRERKFSLHLADAKEKLHITKRLLHGVSRKLGERQLGERHLGERQLGECDNRVNVTIGSTTVG
uniref:Uncharacterized protein n=1 Tax=Romanomermis culicivorax TaxID=13658 RepID=A0A915JAM5_ROMCU